MRLDGNCRLYQEVFSSIRHRGVQYGITSPASKSYGRPRVYIESYYLLRPAGENWSLRIGAIGHDKKSLGFFDLWLLAAYSSTGQLRAWMVAQVVD
jgi:hypothetical protein